MNLDIGTIQVMSELLGHCSDMSSLLLTSIVFSLPSYYQVFLRFFTEKLLLVDV